MNLKITYLPIKEPRLTIAREEVRVKFPHGSDTTDDEKVLAFFKQIVSEIGTPEKTLRGSYHNGFISLRHKISDKRVTFKTFKID